MLIHFEEFCPGFQRCEYAYPASPTKLIIKCPESDPPEDAASVGFTQTIGS